MVRYYFDDFSDTVQRASDDGDRVAHFENESEPFDRIGITYNEGKWSLWSRGNVIDTGPKYEDLFVQAQALWALKPEPSRQLWIDL